MKTITCFVAMLLATCASTFAQTGSTGTWRVEGVGAGPWTLALRADGPRLTGKVSSCTSLPVEIDEGRIAGNSLSFKCKSPDGDRVITFRGSINGDEIMLTWDKQVREGGAPFPALNSLDVGDRNASDALRTGDRSHDMFGASTPRQLTARRVPDGGVEFAAALNLPQKGMKVEGTLFVPPNVKRVRAVIVLLNSGFSWNGMGGSFYLDPQLRRLAETLEAGLYLPRITNIGPLHIDLLRNAALGGADGLISLLSRLAQESGHPEIASAPLLLWGHSRTGHFAATFAALHPQRTIALVAYHSGGAGLAGADMKALIDVPALHLQARSDIERGRAGTGAPDFAETSWKQARSLGAPWTFGIEPDAVHQNPADLAKANDLVIPWIAAVVRQRLSNDGPSLRTVTEGSGWLGDTQTRDVAPFATFTHSKPDANWLPDEASARGWLIVTGARQ